MTKIEELETLPGSPFPLGFSCLGDRVNFALFSSHATAVYLGLFRPGEQKPCKEFSLKRAGGDIWHVGLKKMPEGLEYAYRLEGPHEPSKGLLYDLERWVIDPYARSPATSQHWTGPSDHRKARAKAPDPFDWQGDRPPGIPLNELVIYEMHVRGFSKLANEAPGTYQGLIKKIPHLKELGINAVELMPVFAFDENLAQKRYPTTVKGRHNYWGYSPLHFFAPMRSYSASRDPIQEFKTCVRELHKEGIEVILDVVYNHTGAGNDQYVPSFRGIDNTVYYIINQKGHDHNYTGCGNTINANHPAVLSLILDSLRYWIEEMHVDGFRFDLASALTRGTNGAQLRDPPLLIAMQEDPVISKTKLIAEPWDAAGLYLLGSFSKWGRWMEWNGKFRDNVRLYLNGTENMKKAFANALCGSQDFYPSPMNSINFITCHDGFTLRDLVTYEKKRNTRNGEDNQDGSNFNANWNCGAEGPTEDPKIQKLRERQIRNHFLALFLSQGIPMLLMGDEYGHTRKGNNNAYIQDNELSWFLWDELEKNEDIFQFVSDLIAFRKKHPVLHSEHFLKKNDIDWHGKMPFLPNWEEKLTACSLKEDNSPLLYIAFNPQEKPVTVHLPSDANWHLVVNTSLPYNDNFLEDPASGPALTHEIEMAPYSSLLGKNIY